MRMRVCTLMRIVNCTHGIQRLKHMHFDIIVSRQQKQGLRANVPKIAAAAAVLCAASSRDGSGRCCKLTTAHS